MLGSEILDRFVARNGLHLSHPEFGNDGWTYATDGISAVRVRGKFSNREISECKPLVKWFKMLRKRKFYLYQPVNDRLRTPCEVCKGSGFAEACKVCLNVGELRCHQCGAGRACAGCDGYGFVQSIRGIGGMCPECRGARNSSQDKNMYLHMGEGIILRADQVWRIQSLHNYVEWALPEFKGELLSSDVEDISKIAVVFRRKSAWEAIVARALPREETNNIIDVSHMQPTRVS